MKKGIHIQDVSTQYSRLIPYLFPEARDLKTTPSLYAALHKEQSHWGLAGLALLASPLAIEKPSFSFAMHIFEPWREREIKLILLEHIINLAHNLYAPALQNLQAVSSVSEHKMLKQYHFKQIRNTITHHFSLAHAYSFFEKTQQHLENNNRIPQDVSIADYQEDEAHQISKLCNKEFGSLTHGHLKALGQIPAEGVDYSFSRSFWYQDKLIGSCGIGIKDKLAIFDPLLITTDKRNSWVFTYVMYSILKELLKNGIIKGLAQVHQDNLKIMAVMKRIDADVAKSEALYELNFETENE